MTPERHEIRRLMDAVLAVTAGLELPTVLQRVVEAAAAMTGARYAALGVVGDHEQLAEFVHTGMSAERVEEIGRLPRGQGVLGLLVREPRTLRLADLGDHPASVGFPSGHPVMRSFLGTPVRVRGEVFGNLYLTEKQGDSGEFTGEDEELLEALASVAGAAIANARLHEQSRGREQWLEASQEVTVALLSGMAPEVVLERIARHARELVGADLATIAVPCGEGQLELRVAEGALADRLRGMVFPRDSSVSGEVIATGQALRIDDVTADARAAQPVVAVGEFGPALFVPLSVRGEAFGTLLVGNRGGGRRFDRDDLRLLEAFAQQASLAVDYDQLQRERRRLSVLQDRERIAHDLHDTVIGQLFSVGLQLESLGARISERQPDVAPRMAEMVDSLDVAIAEIRTRVFALTDPDRASGLRDRVLATVEQAEPALGFVPALRVHGPVDTVVSSDVGENLLAVVAEALTNVARHANATRVDVEVHLEAHEVVLRVRDDGHGPPDSPTTGLGLKSVTRRARECGGRASLTTADGGGAVLEWRAAVTGGIRG